MKTTITIVCPCCVWEEKPDEVGDQILRSIVPMDGELFVHLFQGGTYSLCPKFTCKRCGCGFQISLEKGHWGIDDHEPQCQKGRRMEADADKEEAEARGGGNTHRSDQRQA